MVEESDPGAIWDGDKWVQTVITGTDVDTGGGAVPILVAEFAHSLGTIASGGGTIAPIPFDIAAVLRGVSDITNVDGVLTIGTTGIYAIKVVAQGTVTTPTGINTLLASWGASGTPSLAGAAFAVGSGVVLPGNPQQFEGQGPGDYLGASDVTILPLPAGTIIGASVNRGGPDTIVNALVALLITRIA